MQEGYPQEEQERKVKLFKTAKGSVYTYGPEGKTTRFKTVTGEQRPQQDITVFADLSPDEEHEVLSGYLLGGKSKTKVYVLEVEQPDKPPRIVRDIGEVKDPKKVYLGVIKDGAYSLFKQVSVTPVVGWNVFDHRHYQEDGQWYSDRHLGNKVTEIEYK